MATTPRAPAGVDASELVAKTLAADPSLPPIAGGGARAQEMLRGSHYGADGTLATVRSTPAALGAALGESGVRRTGRRPGARPGRSDAIREVTAVTAHSIPHGIKVALN